MSNGRLRLELSDAGSRFRVGDMKGRIRASTGKSTFKMVTVSLIWSVRMVHSVAASGHAALRDRPWHGASHVVLENTSNGTLVILGGSCGHLDSILTGLISCLKDCLRRCTGLGASQGAVQGVSRLWAAALSSLYIAASDCLIRCTGLGASQGAVQGASRLGAV